MHIYTKNGLSLLRSTVKCFLLLGMFFLTGLKASAQVPPNDDICGAIDLPVAAACTPQQFSTIDASSSSNTPFPTCDGYAGNDVWFKFTVPAGATSITLNSGAVGVYSDAAAAIYSFTGADCNSYTLTQVSCLTTGGTLGTGDFPLGTVTVTAGTTYYVRFYGFGGETGQFKICITANIPPPNNNCSSATALTVNPDYACAVTTAGTTVNATQSPETPAPTCGTATGINDDVWYTFVATSTQHRIVLSSVLPAATAMTMQAYSGTCGAFTAIGCSTTGTLDLAGLTAGQTYTVRVYTNTATSTTTATYNICVGTAPPPPVNDDCANATNLTVNPNLLCGTTTAGTTQSATQSTVTPTPTCGTANGWNDDVWYTFTATTTTHRVVIGSILPAGTAMTMQAYSGTCAGGYTAIGCSTTGTLDLTGLTAGQVYTVRVYTNVTTVGTAATFTMCVGTFPPPPANDDCPNAVSLTVNPDQACAVTTAGTTVSATQSTSTPTPTCGTANGWNDDVWFSFVATGPLHRVTLSNITGDATNMTMAVYSGPCGSLTQVGCINGNVLNLTGLTAGTTYYVRVYTNVATPFVFANFNICVGTPPPPPPNDEPCNAITLTPAIAGCGAGSTYTTYTTENATATAGVPAPGCANYAGGDVWFKVTVPAGGTLTIDSQTGVITDGGMAVYSGTCSGLSLVACDDDSSPNGLMSLITLTGQTPGNTLWIRFWEYGNDNPGTFGILVTTPPPPPANDECVNAISITPSGSNTCTATLQGSTYGATQSTTTPAPSCGTANGWNDDVWYKFVCNNPDQRITLSNIAPAGTVLNMAVYSGTCGALTQVGCKSGNVLNLNTLTVGATYYVRIYTDATTAGTNACFDVCITNIPPPGPGEVCTVAQPFCSSSQPSQNSPIVDPPGSTGLGQYGCLFTTPNPTWYVLQIATPGNLSIHIHQQNAAGTGIDVDYAAWGPFTSVAQGCSQIGPTTSTAAPMVACSYSAAADEDVNIPGTQVGQFYILLVTNYNANPGTITFTTNPTNVAQTNCAIVCNATATNSGPVCPSGTFNLFGSSTIAGATYSWTGPGGFTSNQQNPTNVTASATPGSYVYTLTVTAGANTCTGTTTVVVGAAAVTLTSAASTNNQSVCTNSPITNITYSVTGATGATVTGLPPGVTGTYASGVFTISGSPTATGVYNYTVTATGGCATAGTTASGTITVTTGATITLTSAAGTTNQAVCINSPITNITYSTANGVTGATVTGLPAGVTGVYSGGTNGTFTISGTPTASGTFNYTVTTSGGCGNATATGTITVNNATIVLTSAASTSNQTVCVNTAITNIVYTSGNGATNVTVTGLPTGVTGTYSGGTNGTFTISGTPTTTGVFNYTVTATGCGTATQSGTITVSTVSTVTLTSAPATAAQTVCINTAITNITYAIGGGGTGATVTGLPAGVTGTYAAGVFTISGTPTASGTFNYTVSATGGCGVATQSGTITVNPATTIVLTSAAGTAAQTVCINTAITNIVYTTGNGATGATVTGLPSGVTGTYSGGTNGTFTISGTPTVSGTFNYTVSTTGGCGTATLSGTITVNPAATITLSSAAGTNNQSVCVNTAITNITYTTGTGVTGATVAGLPAGVTGTYAAGVFTISGTPTATGTFNYTVTTTGGCATATATGTITVGTSSTLVLTSAAGTTNQTVCINTAISNIVYQTGAGATGATVTGLPSGVTGTYSGGTNGTFTISGTPTVSGTFNYTVSTTGGCGAASLSGTITVNPLTTVTLSSAAGTQSQTVCVNTAITNITYATGSGATGATVTGLPAGVTGTYSGGTNGTVTISGTPTVTGTFTYTVSTTGGCGTATQSGTITVNALATLTLTSAAATTNQTICQNSNIVNITYAVGGSATGATVTGLPTGVTGTYAAGVFTISGTATSAGPFNYTVTTTGGCGVVTRTGTINVAPALFANAGPNVTIASGSSTQLNGTATAGANYLWTANGPLALTSATILNPIANPLQTTTYTLTVTDPLSICPSASSSMVVTVVTSCINVRNAFTPNGDGINDQWLVYDQSFCLAVDGVKVNVYNRYGNQVYESKNYKNTWDGNYKGKPVPDGTYYAVIQFTMSDGSKRFVRTDVTVLR